MKEEEKKQILLVVILQMNCLILVLLNVQKNPSLLLNEIKITLFLLKKKDIFKPSKKFEFF